MGWNDKMAELATAAPEQRGVHIDALMSQMQAWGVSRLLSALDFFEAGVLTREEAVSVCGFSEEVFSRELSKRRRERKRLMRR